MVSSIYWIGFFCIVILAIIIITLRQKIVKDLYTNHKEVYAEYSIKAHAGTAATFFFPGFRRLNLHLWFTNRFFLSSGLKKKIWLLRILSLVCVALALYVLLMYG
ncbi:hypothetical protein GOV14_07065 [Candidatus Pacearchaeota archaeon]|nr:hypothetical protein [Candidatus Pacearchaeota archaeon]